MKSVQFHINVRPRIFILESGLMFALYLSVALHNFRTNGAASWPVAKDIPVSIQLF
jgi:hypothetical protein